MRRRFYELAASGAAPIASEALERIAALYHIEAKIQGRPADARRAERQARSRPLIETLDPWFRARLGEISQKSRLAETSFLRVRPRTFPRSDTRSDRKGGDQLLPVFLSGAEIAREGQRIKAFRSDIFKRKYLPNMTGFLGVGDLFEWLQGRCSIVALGSSAKGEELDAYKKAAGIESFNLTEVSSLRCRQIETAPRHFPSRARLLTHSCLCVC